MLVASTLPLVAAGDSEDGGLSDLNGLGDGGPEVIDADRTPACWCCLVSEVA